MRFLIVALVTIGCNNSSPAPPADAQPDAPSSRDFNDCSWRDPAFGVSVCTTDPDTGKSSCTCDAEGSGCSYSNFENGCDCTCGDVGGSLYWLCIPDEEFSSPCPVRPPADAGV